MSDQETRRSAEQSEDTGDTGDTLPDAGTDSGGSYLDVESWIEPSGGAGGVTVAAPGEADGAGLTFEEPILAALLAERDEYLDSLRRLQADFENFRKRMHRQQQELVERAAESLLGRLLPVLDAFDLAVAHVGASPADRGAAPSAVVAGGHEPNGGSGADPAASGPPVEVRPFLQIASLLRDSLAKEGLEAVADVGVEFDPTVHDAVAHEAAEPGEPSGVVVEVMRPGYRLKGRVLRAAMVKVRG